MCRSGFTREYGGGGDGERRVEIGQQGPASSRVNPLLRATAQAFRIFYPQKGRQKPPKPH
ncbi:hypothetical protein PRJ_1238 [Pseudomonas sp. XWY-1]|nr:hypothetical protein PRJ_1238 [Pseudomonas sp. XWY-1]